MYHLLEHGIHSEVVWTVGATPQNNHNQPSYGEQSTEHNIANKNEDVSPMTSHIHA